MKCQFDEMPIWWNVKLMKCRLDEKPLCWNLKYPKWQVDEMLKWWEGKSMPWQVNKTASWYVKLMKWIADENRNVGSMASWWNDKINEIASWWNDKLTRWPAPNFCPHEDGDDMETNEPLSSFISKH